MKCYIGAGRRRLCSPHAKFGLGALALLLASDPSTAWAQTIETAQRSGQFIAVRDLLGVGSLPPLLHPWARVLRMSVNTCHMRHGTFFSAVPMIFVALSLGCGGTSEETADYTAHVGNKRQAVSFRSLGLVFSLGVSGDRVFCDLPRS